ncbi:MAG: carboxylating nicotinate-nucleotide diphosphorylase [Acidimicrobiia bacterium]|nr:carboxylating nicotinate-nucleotide diphosphorylase [Acidimicrobiia bacterium]
MVDAAVRAFLKRALEEDIGSGDITTEACVRADARSAGSFYARQAMVVAGVELVPVVYELHGGASAGLLVSGGARVEAGTRLAQAEGSARTLLTCERVALNLLQRLSGVATLAAKYVDAVAGTKTRILDTRKTTPGLRRLEKAAAAAGGVVNHRMGLFDAVLIKNNHITAAGGVTEALQRVKGRSEKVEIEVRTREELEEALAGGARHLLLDNLTPAEAAEWIRHIGERATVELSGRISLDNVRAYAEAGADYISCGAITHSAAAVDINFRIE